MKKTILILTGISVFAGAAYAGFAYSPLGKATLSKWLLKKWEEMGKTVNHTMNLALLKQELQKLDYSDHELLFRYTRFVNRYNMNIPQPEKITKKFKKLYKRLHDARILQRADLSSLENSVLPG